MALNTNLHIIAGSLGQDPIVKYAASGTCICELSIATSHWDAQAEESVTDWHKVILIGRQAVYVGEYGKKGSEITVSGRVQTRKWEDRDGQPRYTTETICFDAQLTRANKQESAQHSQPPRPAQPGSNSYAAAKSGSARPAPNVAGQGGFDDMDDDIPF